MSAHSREAIERMLGGDCEPDGVLRGAVSTLVEEPGIAWAGIAFLEQDDLVLGPAAGRPDQTRRASVPISYRGFW